MVGAADESIDLYELLPADVELPRDRWALAGDAVNEVLPGALALRLRQVTKRKSFVAGNDARVTVITLKVEATALSPVLVRMGVLEEDKVTVTLSTEKERRPSALLGPGLLLTFLSGGGYQSEFVTFRLEVNAQTAVKSAKKA
jgi:hypothetical protein